MIAHLSGLEPTTMPATVCEVDIPDQSENNEAFLSDASKGLRLAAMIDVDEETRGAEHEKGSGGTTSNTSGQVPDTTSSADSLKDYTKDRIASEQQHGDDFEKNAPQLQRFKTGLLSPRLKDHRKKILKIFVFTNLLLGALVISVLSIYWGATYNRDHYMFKVSVLSVIQDESDLVPLTMTNELRSLSASNPCTWHIYTQAEFMSKFNVTAEEVDDKVRDLIYEEKYWMGLNSKPNATNDLYRALSEGSTAFLPADYFTVWYMSGRDPTSVKSSMLPNIQELEEQYATYYSTSYLPQLISNITSSNVNASAISPSTIIDASIMKFTYVDYRPFYDQVLLSPLQVGLIYCLLLTFFQLSLFGPLHGEMAQFLRPKHMIIYRILISWLTYVFLSLFFCTVSAIYQINFTLAFGRGGFVVYWMSTFLLMMALGGANENVLSILFAYGPQYLGFWLVLWIILNISCSFYPMVLNNEFYRYGYAMPIHNGVDIFKVVFLNLSRHKMGRNYGILVAWIALNTTLFPFVMKVVGEKMKKNREQAAAASSGPPGGK